MKAFTSHVMSILYMERRVSTPSISAARFLLGAFTSRANMIELKIVKHVGIQQTQMPRNNSNDRPPNQLARLRSAGSMDSCLSKNSPQKSAVAGQNTHLKPGHNSEACRKKKHRESDQHEHRIPLPLLPPDALPCGGAALSMQVFSCLHKFYGLSAAHFYMRFIQNLIIRCNLRLLSLLQKSAKKDV